MHLVSMVAVAGWMMSALFLVAAEMPQPDKMFPDGTDHYFGKVRSGTLVKHAFRVVNTSDVPLRVISVRLS